VYTELRDGSVKKYQLFFSDHPGTLTCRYSSEESDGETQHLMLKDTRRQQHIDEYLIVGLRVIPPPGIAFIKRVELSKKWCKYVPEQFRSPLYDSPGKEIEDKVKADTKARKLAREEAKKTANDADTNRKKRKAPSSGFEAV